MTSEQQQVKDWMKAFGQETPEKPTVPSLEVRKLRAKLILEEALETIKALGFEVVKADASSFQLILQSWELIRGRPTIIKPNLLEIADGCEDLKVVTEGTLVACGLANYVYYSNPVENTKHILCIDPLFNEVMRSNWSKMWTQQEIETRFTCVEDTRYVTISHHNDDKNKRDIIVKDSSGKVIKSPSYSPANLQPIIDSLA